MLKLDRQTFFQRVRRGPFPGRLTQSQVDGMTDLLDAWETYGTRDPRHLAYTLATDFHETGAKMQPVREGFALTDAGARRAVANLAKKRGPNSAVAKYARPAGPYGHVYYGRGDVQLTWLHNYQEMQDITGLPLVREPDLLLKSSVSKRVLIEGMVRGASGKGDFTGLALEDFFNATRDDPVGARRIVNGTDKAHLIATYHREFLAAIEEAIRAYQQPDLLPEPTPEEKPAKLPPKTDEVSWGGGVTMMGGLMAGSGAWLDNVPWPVVAGAVILILVGGALIAHGRLKIVRNTGE